MSVVGSKRLNMVEFLLWAWWVLEDEGGGGGNWGHPFFFIRLYSSDRNPQYLTEYLSLRLDTASTLLNHVPCRHLLSRKEGSAPLWKQRVSSTLWL